MYFSVLHCVNTLFISTVFNRRCHEQSDITYNEPISKIKDSYRVDMPAHVGTGFAGGNAHNDAIHIPNIH